jgi:hypothetical protein
VPTLIIVCGLVVAAFSVVVIVSEFRAADRMHRRVRGFSVAGAVIGGLFGLGALVFGVLSIS